MLALVVLALAPTELEFVGIGKIALRRPRGLRKVACVNGEPGMISIPEHEYRAAFTDWRFADRSGPLSRAAHRYAEQCNNEGEDWACGSGFHLPAIIAAL